MEREIKFRVWYPSKFDDDDNPIEFKMTNDWAFEEYLPVNEQLKILGNTPHHTIMQYTGLKDKNVREIYEGDILECDGYRVEMMFRAGQFVGFNEKLKIPETQNRNWLQWEVIGNIFQNPDLLK